jgi:hypothetical protein
VRIYLETDPGVPQIEVAQGCEFTIDLLAAHTHHLTYAENLGAPDCGVPVGRFRYLPTRQPVVLDWWSHEEPPNADAGRNRAYTTVANWQQSSKEIEWNGETYYCSKHLEFLKIIDLPRWVEPQLELALACGDDEAIRALTAHGWRVVDALALSRDILSYRAYLQGSRAEFTVARDQNIRLRSGWFSDRSACYLAAGKPVITQDTAFGNILPTGEGLFAFRTLEEIVAAVESIEREYERHSRAARAIAQDHFAAERVLSDLIDAVGL